jgi:hypothetical protein
MMLEATFKRCVEAVRRPRRLPRFVFCIIAAWAERPPRTRVSCP